MFDPICVDRTGAQNDRAIESQRAIDIDVSRDVNGDGRSLQRKLFLGGDIAHQGKRVCAFVFDERRENDILQDKADIGFVIGGSAEVKTGSADLDGARVGGSGERAEGQRGVSAESK